MLGVGCRKTESMFTSIFLIFGLHKVVGWEYPTSKWWDTPTLPICTFYIQKMERQKSINTVFSTVGLALPNAEWDILMLPDVATYFMLRVFALAFGSTKPT